MYIIILLFLGIIILFLLVKNYKIKENITKEINHGLAQELKKRREEIDKQLQEIFLERRKELTQLEEAIKQKKNFNDSLFQIRDEELNRLITSKQEQQEKLLKEKIENKKNEELSKLNSFLESYKKQTEVKSEELKKELEQILEEIEDFRKKRDSINVAILREKEIQEKEDFFKIDISRDNQEDIAILQEIKFKLKNRDALPKLIWEVFIQRPTQEMIKRVTGGKEISGIYKITFIKTGEAYIGKTTNIKTRWINHVKTAIGLEGAAHATVHTKMEKEGIWNFTFEILEEVPKDKLTEREKFYIKLYDTTKQLNMREG